MIIIVKFIKYKRKKIIVNFTLLTIISTLTTFMCFTGINSTSVVNGKPLELMSYQKTFNSTLSSADKVSPSIGTRLSPGMKVIITRVKISTINQTKSINFKTIIRNDPKALKSLSRILQNGVSGKKIVTSNITYKNGKEVARKVIKEKVTKTSKHKIIIRGTLPIITFSRGSSSKPSGKVIKVKATAYSPVNGINNTYTASGKKAVRNPYGYSTIAVDPRVIPLGTKLYVEGYGYATAEDKGSAVKGKYIDVFFNTNKEAINWGVKYLNVQILK